MTPEMKTKCSTIIHRASIACFGVGAGLGTITESDWPILSAIQTSMVVSLGLVFDMSLSEQAVPSIKTSLSCTAAGRFSS